MITSYSVLQETIRYEREQYCRYMFPSRWRLLMGWVKQEPMYLIMKWQVASRKTDYYKYRIDNTPSVIDKVKYLYYIRKRNILGNQLGIELNTIHVGKGLFIYHGAGGLVCNGSVTIGNNCHLHGNNCIGNAGPHDDRCPTLGDDVMVGVGAKIIGPVKVADRVKIAAGAVVVHDILEEGCTIAGVPAKIVKHES